MATPKGRSRRAGPIRDDEQRRRIIQSGAGPRSTGVEKYFTPQANKARSRNAQSRQGRSAITALVAAGGSKPSAKARNQFESWFGAPWSGSGSSSVATATQKSLNKVAEGLKQEIRDTYTERKAIEQEYAVQELDKPVDVNEDPYAAAGEVLAPSIDEQFLGGHVGQVMEKVQRPMAAIAGGLYNAKAEEDPDASTWNQFKDAFGSFGEGFSKGIQGKEHHGMGDVYEIVKDTSPNLLAKGLRNLEEHAPWVEQAIAVGAGSLDLAMDPTNYVGLKGVAMAGREVATAKSMRRLTDDIAERISTQYDDEVVQNLAKGPGGVSVAPSQPAVKQYVVRELENMLDVAELDISGGGSRGGRYRVLSPGMTAENAGAMGGQAIQQAVTSNFRERVQKVIDGIQGKGPKQTGNDLVQLAHESPDFARYIDDVGQQLVRDQKIPANFTFDDIADNLTVKHNNTLREIEQDLIDRNYAPGIAKVSNDITREFTNNFYHAPAIRVGKKAIPIKAAGRAYAALDNKVMGSAQKNFNYNAAFPGSLSVDASRARAYMVPGMEEWEKDLRGRARAFKPQEGIDMQHAVERALPGGSPAQQSFMDWGRQQMDGWFEDQMAIGARGRERRSDLSQTIKPTTHKLDTYVPVYNKGGSLNDRTTFKRERKAEIQKTKSAGRYKTENARSKKLKPNENFSESLRQGRIKHNRDMTRALFRADMLDKYGVFSKMDSKGQHFSAESRNLVEVKFAKLPEHLRLIAEKEGGDFFLPKQMDEMLKQFDEITQWNGANQGRAARFFTKVMSAWKTLQTLPWPGFHNKNMIGDFFMGFLDRINPMAYFRMARMFKKAMRGEVANFKFAGGLTYSFSDMWKRYQMEANSGFAATELSNLGAPGKYNLPKRVFQQGYKTMRDISGMREDIGRFTHYTEAFRQEAKELFRKGERDISRLDAKAGSAAHWRVNNYRFDYNALSLWEKKVKTLAFPFYTFIRKAAPTLVQAIYQDPRWINQWTRYLYQNSQGAEGNAGEFDAFMVPEDIRMMGYAMLSNADAAEPWAVSNDILPTGALNAVKTHSSHDFFNSILSQTMAPAQLAIEQGTGRDIYQDKPLGEDSGLWEGIKDIIPGMREYGQFRDPNSSWKEKLISGRFAGGLPIRPISENQQQFAQQEWQDRLIDNPLQQFNTSQDLYYISEDVLPNGQRYYEVQDNQQLDETGAQGKIIKKFYTAKEAMDFARTLVPADYKQIETVPEFDNQGNLIQRPVGR